MSDSHYYDKDGNPRYEAGLREARKEHLLPSVTTYLQSINKPGLIKWKEGKIYDKFLDYWELGPKYIGDGKDREGWRKRIKDELTVDLAVSANEGTRIHSAIEKFLKSGKKVEGYEAYVEPLIDYLNEYEIKVQKIEHSYSNYELGYGGKIDLVCTYKGDPAILDWKTKDTKDKPGPTKLYHEVPMQLTANASGIGIPDAKLVAVVVSRDEPGKFESPVVWEDDGKYFKGFQCAQILWCIEKNYNPWNGGKWFS